MQCFYHTLGENSAGNVRLTSWNYNSIGPISLARTTTNL